MAISNIWSLIPIDSTLYYLKNPVPTVLVSIVYTCKPTGLRRIIMTLDLMEPTFVSVATVDCRDNKDT